ncbi:unnamed protein product [Didymodactylos carnosus]|uniref:Uncharacterized protein n=1 Tax=Didymodactylos carnosus TaxID=1234261 RepID=A0A813Q4P3_9BILA|nr:unnamed protein product [Didymodactylos carnosus]CAF0776107.1 unnamed protein product [Didymodactylos carnosus]CAF3542926.1 unnamed protein product [Didymodactylos carnosus]CAF3557304.1 unnamed protein product [Didymodactylos carnosus]
MNFRITTAQPLNASTINQQQQEKNSVARFRSKIKETIGLNKITSQPDDTYTKPERYDDLQPESQEMILRAFEVFHQQNIESAMTAIDESRNLLRETMEEFTQEQEDYRRQLEDIGKNRHINKRRRENAIPLAIYMKQKRDVLDTGRPNSGLDSTYQGTWRKKYTFKTIIKKNFLAYFEALLADESTHQHPSDKAAVVKYIRRRERRKRAEENRKQNELTDAILEKQTQKIINNMEGMDVKLENERQRQNELLKQRMEEKKAKHDITTKANDIMEMAHEGELARQRLEQSQREKIDARLSAARLQRMPTNLIHVHGQDEDTVDNDLAIATKNSIQLLSDSNSNERQFRTHTSVYGDGDTEEKTIANIHI